LRNKLWREDTFVDFNHSLNAAIKRLRDALGESADASFWTRRIAYLNAVRVTRQSNGSDGLNCLRSVAYSGQQWDASWCRLHLC
jgi:hypothetical protein